MRIPASRLVDLLTPGVFCLRNASFNCLNSALPFGEAVAMAVRGEIEGIATAGGRIKYLRQLPEDERETEIVEQQTAERESRSTAFARTNLGVFREPLREAIVRPTPWGHAVVRAEGEVTGYCYSFCALR